MQEATNFEQAVINVLRDLPLERQAQVLDFAKFLKMQNQGVPLTEERVLMRASIQSLSKYWDTPEEDEAWAYLQKATSFPREPATAGSSLTKQNPKRSSRESRKKS